MFATPSIHSLAVAIDDIDLGFRVSGFAKPRLENRLPPLRCLGEVPLAGPLARLRHLHLIGEALELVRVGTDHQAQDLIGALLTEIVLIVVERLFPDLLIAPIIQEPALRSLREFVLGKTRPDREQSQGGVGIGRVLFPPEQRQVHLGDEDVSQFMRQQNERISGHEFDPVDPLLFREASQTRTVQGGLRSGLDPLPKASAEPAQPVVPSRRPESAEKKCCRARPTRSSTTTCLIVHRHFVRARTATPGQCLAVASYVRPQPPGDWLSEGHCTKP